MVLVEWEFFLFSVLDVGLRGLGLRGGLFIAVKYLIFIRYFFISENKEGFNVGWWF